MVLSSISATAAVTLERRSRPWHRAGPRFDRTIPDGLIGNDAAQGYDYIIVGAGSAGCVVANRLSADPSCRVLLLEAGGSDRNFWLKLPVGYYRTIFNERFSRLFKTEPHETTGGRSIVWPRGRVLGGSSSINGLIFIRGQHEDFDDWERLGASGWSYRELLPYFRRYERYSGGESQYHGGLGEFEVSDLRNNNAASAAWVEAGVEFGLPRNSDFNGETTYGVGSYQLGIGRHWRTSSASAFLKPVAHRPNLTVITGAQVSKVTFRGSVATGVEWIKNGQTFSASADREVILSAGALQSPQILQLVRRWSGRICCAGFGIPVVADSPEVGRNLQDHYQARLIVRLKQRISLNDQVRNPVELAKMGLQWMFAGSGPLTVGAGQVGGAACTEYAVGGTARRSVQRHAAVGRQARRSPAQLFRIHGIGLAVPRQIARTACDPLNRSVRAAAHRAQLLCRGDRPQDHGRGPEDSARAFTGRNRSAISGISRWCRAKLSTWRCRPVGFCAQRPAARCFTASAPAGWEATMNRCSIRNCGFAASRDCA